MGFFGEWRSDTTDDYFLGQKKKENNVEGIFLRSSVRRLQRYFVLLFWTVIHALHFFLSLLLPFFPPTQYISLFPFQMAALPSIARMYKSKGRKDNFCKRETSSIPPSLLGWQTRQLDSNKHRKPNITHVGAIQHLNVPKMTLPISSFAAALLLASFAQVCGNMNNLV